MLSILSNEKKIAPDDLIQELINPESTNEVLDEIYKITKVDLNSLNFNDEPILHVCCKKDIYISVLWLLENKIDINIQNEHQETALFYAIYSRNSGLLQMLVDFGANINQLNISKDDLYNIVYKRYNIKINSLKELGEQNLNKLRVYIYSLKG